MVPEMIHGVGVTVEGSPERFPILTNHQKNVRIDFSRRELVRPVTLSAR
jgi:hypothetical protein